MRDLSCFLSLPDNCFLLPNQAGFCRNGVCLCFQGFSGKLCTNHTEVTCRFATEDKPDFCLDEIYPFWSTSIELFALHRKQFTFILRIYVTLCLVFVNDTACKYGSTKISDPSVAAAIECQHLLFRCETRHIFPESCLRFTIHGHRVLSLVRLNVLTRSISVKAPKLLDCKLHSLDCKLRSLDCKLRSFQNHF